MNEEKFVVPTATMIEKPEEYELKIEVPGVELRHQRRPSRKDRPEDPHGEARERHPHGRPQEAGRIATTRDRAPVTQKPPKLGISTVGERRRFVRTKYPCIANCEQCGQCAIFHGHDAETAFADYIDGRRKFADVLKDYRR